MRRIYIGTSGYYYKHWVGKFYPEDYRSSQFFKYYQKYFYTVEINYTFYHFPREIQVASWNRNSSSDFIFSVKAPGIITHKKRLKNCKDQLLLFFHLIKPLRSNNKLGAVLFQTPASFEFDINVIKKFIDELPKGYKYVFEFRNKEYYDKKIYQMLKDKNIDFAYISEPNTEPYEDVIATFKYFRLHGLGSRYSSSYLDKDLMDLALKIIRVEKSCKDGIFVYFNNDYNAYAPKNATRLIEIIRTYKKNSF